MRPLRRCGALAAGLVLGFLASGCASLSGDFGTPIATEYLARIRDGETTRLEIILWFGPPSAFFNPTFLEIIVGDIEEAETPAPLLDDVYTYRFIENATKVFFVPILFAKIDAAATAETLTVFFDAEGRVKYHAYRRDQARPTPEQRP